MTNTFQGIITALITPFSDDKIDFAAFEKILQQQIDAGIKTVVVAGSTGEGASLSANERAELIAKALEHRQLNVIAGCSGLSTRQTLQLAQEAQALGACGLMLNPPVYAKATQEGIFAHFKSIHDATSIPIMLYSVPSRTGVDFSDQTIYRLCELERVQALKDAGGDAQRALRLRADLGSKISILAGDDYLALAFFAHGAKGLVSVASNLVPELVISIQNLWNKAQMTQALDKQTAIFPLYKELFSHSNPMGIKYAMHLAGFGDGVCRIPLSELDQQSKQVLKNLLAAYLKI